MDLFLETYVKSVHTELLKDTQGPCQTGWVQGKLEACHRTILNSKFCTCKCVKFSSIKRKTNELHVWEMLLGNYNSISNLFCRPLCHISVKRRVWKGRNDHLCRALQTEEHPLRKKYVCWRGLWRLSSRVRIWGCSSFTHQLTRLKPGYFLTDGLDWHPYQPSLGCVAVWTPNTFLGSVLQIGEWWMPSLAPSFTWTISLPTTMTNPLAWLTFPSRRGLTSVWTY